MKGLFSFLWEIIKIVILALVIVIPIRYFLFQPFLVKGQSMEPNFHDGDYLIVDQISYRFREPERGEVIVFKYPNFPGQRFLKRIIGLAGEIIEIKNGEVKIYKGNQVLLLDEFDYLPKYLKTSGDIKVSLAENEYFVLGDNRLVSADSRSWGPLQKKYVVGRVAFRLWPITTFAKIEVPAY